MLLYFRAKIVLRSIIFTHCLAINNKTTTIKSIVLFPFKSVTTIVHIRVKKPIYCRHFDFTQFCNENFNAFETIYSQTANRKHTKQEAFHKKKRKQFTPTTLREKSLEYGRKNLCTQGVCYPIVCASHLNCFLMWDGKAFQIM